MKECLTFKERASTPPEIRKYRRSANLAPGKKFQHFGTADDIKSLDLDAKIFGDASEPARTTAADLLSHQKLSDFDKLSLLKAEKCYKGAARDQLGKTVSHNYGGLYKEMEGIVHINFWKEKKVNFYFYLGKAFGIKTVSSLEPAKEIIFPTLNENTMANEEIYKKYFYYDFKSITLIFF